MFDPTVCYARILSDYVYSVRRFSDFLWTERQVSLGELLGDTYYSLCYGECYGFYQALRSMYKACDCDDNVIPRPLDFREMLKFPEEVKVSGPHFRADVFLNFYPDIHTLHDQGLDTIKLNPKRYLIKTGEVLYGYVL